MANGPLSSFLNSIGREKALVPTIYQSMKRDVPPQGLASLMRDFRVDEDHTMAHGLDPQLEGYHPGLQLVDRIKNVQKERIQGLIK